MIVPIGTFSFPYGTLTFPILYIGPESSPGEGWNYFKQGDQSMSHVSRRSVRRATLALAAALAVAAIAPLGAQAATKNVVVVGNASAGTVSFLDGANYSNIGSINVVPDLAWRKAALFLNPITLVGFQVVVGQKGGERIVDDVALSPNGKTLYVSRGVLEDTVAFSLVTRKMLWRTDIGSFNSDHMTISPDGSKLIVSATTSKKAQVLNAADGKIITSFETGDYPHENTYSADGKTIYNASIGTTAFPFALNGLKGDREITAVDATTFVKKKAYKFDYGIRPSVLTNDERYYYAQLSYSRGFVEYDLLQSKITRTATLPGTPAGDAIGKDDYPSNSAHHGLAMNGAGTKFCNAGTIDNYVKIVDRTSFAVTATVSNLQKPYWSTTSHDGSKCLVSNSDGDFISVIDYATGAEVKRITVGDYPQRERLHKIDTSVIAGLSRSAG